jgi:hypothetical protein
MGYWIIIATWIYYLASMHLLAHKDQLHPVAKIHGWIFVIIPGLLYDAFLNAIIASIIFMDPPREVLLTARLKRYKKGTGWRRKWALWTCEHLLDQFDEGGHC